MSCSQQKRSRGLLSPCIEPVAIDCGRWIRTQCKYASHGLLPCAHMSEAGLAIGFVRLSISRLSSLKKSGTIYITFAKLDNNIVPDSDKSASI